MPAHGGLSVGQFNPLGQALAEIEGATVVEAPLHAVVLGQGPPLLLVQGLLASGDMFAPIVHELALRYRLVIPDLRGQGASSSLPGPYGPAQQAADLAALLDFLEIRNAAVLGYSQGGPVVLRLRHDRPDLAGAVILACTYAFNGASFMERFQAALGKWLMKAIGPQRLGRVALGQGGGARMTHEQKAWMAGVISACPRENAVALFDGAMAFDARPLLQEVSVPTLVVAAPNDRAVPARHGRTLRQGIPGATYVEVPGSGHFMIVTHSDEFATILIEWLASVHPHARR